MKQLIFYVFTIILVALELQGQISKPLIFNIRLENGFNKPWDNLILGVAPDATEKMDSIYQEVEIPDFPFPSGIFTAVCLTYDSTEKKDIWSYRSVYGPTGDKKKFMIKYKFRVFYGYSNYVKMSWLALPPEIDSAIIMDSFGGYKFKVNMKEKLEGRNDEILVENFDVDVYYNFTNVGVISTLDDKINVYPNPTKNILQINSDDSIKMIEVCNILGVSLFYKNVDDKEINIDLSGLQPDVYLLKLIKYNNDVIVKKIIKE